MGDDYSHHFLSIIRDGSTITTYHISEVSGHNVEVATVLFLLQNF